MNKFEEYIKQGEPDKKEKGLIWQIVSCGFQRAKEQKKEFSKGKICTLNCTLEEHFVLEFIKDNPSAIQREMDI